MVTDEQDGAGVGLERDLAVHVPQQSNGHHFGLTGPAFLQTSTSTSTSILAPLDSSQSSAAVSVYAAVGKDNVEGTDHDPSIKGKTLGDRKQARAQKLVEC